jgi:hypothetical protein
MHPYVTFKVPRPLINLPLLQGQYVDGLRAPLVLHPQTEAHAYDDEFIVVLGDWYHHEHSTLLKHFLSIANPRGAEPIPGGYLDFVVSLILLFRIQTRASFILHKMSPTLVQNLGRHLPLLPQQSDSMKMPHSPLYLGRPTDSVSSTCLLYQHSTSGLMVIPCASLKLTV